MGSDSAPSELLFSYGTLQLESVQLATFGRRLAGTSDALPGYKVVPLKIDDPAVASLSGKAVHTMATPTGCPSDVIAGIVFAVTPDEIQRADAYEVPAVRRVSLVLQSGARAWVYVDAAAQRSLRVYLACTVRGDRSGVAAGRAICERLQKNGHEVLTTHLLSDRVEADESRLSEEHVFQRDIDWLTSCDVLIAEASGSSYGVGFEVGYVLGRARQSGQKVVLLYDASRTGAISRLIVGNCDPACTTVGYESILQLTHLIDSRFPPTKR